ncbi:MAG: hypothetical protein JWQ46_1354 [Phenylobacterium sp.]|nr:hypothetical protein [Phenylobacterium sp.]
MRRLLKFAALLSLCMGATACANSLDAPLSPTFGQAVASLQSQIVPASVSTEPPVSSGARGAAAIQRLEKGQVMQPDYGATSALGGMGRSPNTPANGNK